MEDGAMISCTLANSYVPPPRYTGNNGGEERKRLIGNQWKLELATWFSDSPLYIGGRLVIQFFHGCNF